MESCAFGNLGPRDLLKGSQRHNLSNFNLNLARSGPRRPRVEHGRPTSFTLHVREARRSRKERLKLVAAGKSAQVGNVRVERVGNVKLSRESYAELCLVLARVPRTKLVLGKGRQPSPHGSYGRIAKMFGISRPRVSQIARDVRQGRANPNRAYGTRAMKLAPKASTAHGGALQSYAEGVSLPSPGAGQPAILQPSPGASMLAALRAVAEGRLNLF